MATDTVNQKVFVPLRGVLALQNEVKRVEQNITEGTVVDGVIKNQIAVAARPYQLQRHDALKFAIETLGLPIEIRSYVGKVF